MIKSIRRCQILFSFAERLLPGNFASGKIFSGRTLLLTTALASLVSAARANDLMYPAAPAAASTISFDGKGYLVHGKREFIASGSIHYARVPRELWHDRLLKLKRAGFNTVQTYVFWNFHETLKDQIDFTTGAHDLGAFLQEAQNLGLYATVRVGPYDCAEWDSGGYPVWLRNVPDLKVRSDNPAFLDAVDKFWDKLLPIVAAHQIHRGGNVIMVQLENEDPQGWGTEFSDKPYHAHLQKKALDLGLEVPYFFSGLHHGTDPAGNWHWDSANRTNPWFSTETWVRWYDKYGNSDPDALSDYTRHIWNIIANGGNGFNLYMFLGGSNFDYFNDDSNGSSYDYGTLIGEGGDLRNLYYSIKRAGTFATSFPDILDNGNDASSKYDKFATGRDVPGKDPAKPTPSVHPFARTSPAGTVVFIRNTQKTPKTATLQSGQTLNLDSREVAPILVDTTLAPGIRTKLAVARTLGLATHGATTTWIVYGKPDEKGHVELDLDQDASIAPGASTSTFQVQPGDAKHPTIDLTYSEDAPQALLLTTGGQTLRIVAETPAWADRTWIVGERGAQTVITGPDFVGDYAETAGKAQFTAARNFDNPALKNVTLYGESPAARPIAVTEPAPNDDVTAPALGAWQMAKATAPAAPDFADASWFVADPSSNSKQPPQLGADGDPTAYGWYRAGFDSPGDGPAKLAGEFYDNAAIFLNGERVAQVHGWHKDIALDVKAGHNTLAVFTSHSGRPKAFGYVDKPIDTYMKKGILGNVTVTVGTQAIPVTGWKLHGGIPAPDAPDLTWEAPAPANLGAPTFFRTSFEAKAPLASGPCAIYRISVKGLTRGSVWLNGHNLGRYPLRLDIDGLYLPECWLKDGTNSLVIFDEEGNVPSADVHLWCEKAASRDVFQIQE